MIRLNKENFEQEVIRSEIPVFVDYWNEVCFQCLAVKPILEKLEAKYKDRVKFAKANVSEIGDVATKYGIMSLPTLLIFKNGQVIHQFVGNQPQNVFEEELDKL